MNENLQFRNFVSHYIKGQRGQEFFEKIRWSGVPKCPICSNINTYALPTEKRHQCNKCKRSFSVRSGTIMENSKIPLEKWLMVIICIGADIMEFSGRRLGRIISVDKKSATSMIKKIRGRLESKDPFLIGVLEGYRNFGGKE